MEYMGTWKQHLFVKGKKPHQPNLTLNHSKSWKVKNVDKKNSDCLKGHQFLSVTTAVFPVKIKLVFYTNYLIYYILSQCVNFVLTTHGVAESKKCQLLLTGGKDYKTST